MRRCYPSVLFVALLAILATASPSCIYFDSATEATPSSFDEIEFHPEFDWNMERVVVVDVEIADSLNVGTREATFEVRHTIDGGRLLFRGTVSEASAWIRRVTVRIPHHERELAVAARGDGWIQRQVVVIDDDDVARYRFE